jgi:phosphoribosylanthranilate isomerase
MTAQGPGAGPARETGTPALRPGVPDILRRITERRRERLAEHRRGDPNAYAAVASARGSSPGAALTALMPRDNPFLAALAHPRRAVASVAATAPSAALPPLHTPPPAVALDTLAAPAPPPSAAPTPAPAIIAEVKLGSPRLGSLQGRIDPIAQARLYAEHGAAALSVVVEPDFFHGSYQLLADCRAASGLPAIAKDFVVDPLQLAWARDAGADAVLLIAALYEAEDLLRYACLARGLGLAPLIEVHDAAAVRAAAESVGLDLLQFSGDETPAAVRPFAGRAIKALRLGQGQGGDEAAVTAFAGCWGLLLDSPAAAGGPGVRAAGAAGRGNPAGGGSPGAPGASAPLYGGTGRAWDYDRAAAVIAAGAGAQGGPGAMAGRRVFLAGGLGPANVRRVVAAIRPFAVDVCSGVEAAPGRKDPRLLRQLFEEIGNGQAPVAT